MAANTGVKLDSKDLMKSWIEKMHIAYNEVASDYDSYALGDLKVYEILKANAVNTKTVYEAIGIGERANIPKLSIGATVAELFKEKIGALFDVDGKALNQIIDLYCRKGTAQYLLTKRSLTSCYLAKVDGGRCRNNRPLDTHIISALCDLDISGCYGEGQRSQLYPFGNPLVLEFSIESRINKFPTLREFLESVRYGQDDCELVYGLWQARVSTKKELSFEQDFITSWFDMTFSELEGDENTSDEINEHIADVLDTKTGKNKILLNEITHGVIQSDFLDWLFEICGKLQRVELLDSLYVESAIIYPASERCYSLDELKSKTESEHGENTCILKYKSNDGHTHKIMTENESYAWFGVNLGEFIIDGLLANRKSHPKKNADGSKNPLNEYFKLMVNTLYGDLVSPYFAVGNTTVGNNITARARAMCWYMEKGLYGFQSITDGCAFDLNKVVYPKPNRQWKVAATDYCGMYRRPLRGANYQLAPLGGYDKIELTYPDNAYPMLHLYKDNSVESLEGYKAQAWINRATFEHLQNLFPNVSVLHKETSSLSIVNMDANNRVYTPRKGIYEFEMKDFYIGGCFHSSANYWLKSFNPKNDAFKMRSYEKKKHDTVRIEENEFEMLDTYNEQTPAQYFMKQLSHADKIERGYVFAKDYIIKPGEYVQRHDSLFKHSCLTPGDTGYKAGLLREFSLSQFTFRTIVQFKAWNVLIDKLKKDYGQSIEMFFINDDKTLNYQAMIEWFDNALDKQVSPTKTIGALFKKKQLHPRFKDFLAVKKEFAHRSNTEECFCDYGDDD